MMKDATYPTTELMPLIWQTGGQRYDRGDPGRGVIEYNWKLDEYLRTTVSRYTKDQKSIQFRPQDQKYEIPGGFHKYYITPHIEWEFVHPKLPIIRVTAQNSKVFPLTLPGMENPGPTEYSVSFVISFQNRWDSLDDPNRWVKRFKETPWGDGRGYHNFLNGETPWDYTGIRYDETPGRMAPHRLHAAQDHRTGGPPNPRVSRTGTRNILSRPQHQQLGCAGIHRNRPAGSSDHRDRKGTTSKKKLRWYPTSTTWPQVGRPTQTCPCQGHVITDAFTGPGTDIWNEHQMNENEW